MMLSAKLWLDPTLRAMICQEMVIRTKIIVLASATLAAPLKLWMSIRVILLFFRNDQNIGHTVVPL
jgi:hypothetical protein